MPLLFYSNHESGHFVVSNTWEANALISIPWNKEVILWMDENTNGIHIASDLEGSKHVIDGMRYVVFYFVLLELDT